VWNVGEGGEDDGVNDPLPNDSNLAEAS